MKTLLKIRTEMELSQSKLATYLGVSKSLIYHIEKGLRSMPTRAMIKLGELYLCFLKHAGSRQIMEPQYEKAKECISQIDKNFGDIEKVNNKIERLKRKLIRMKKAFSKCMTLDIVNKAVAERIELGNPGNGDRLWLLVNQSDIKAALKRCNVIMQEEIEAKIMDLKSKVVAMQESIPKDNECIEVPLARLKEAV